LSLEDAVAANDPCDDVGEDEEDGLADDDGVGVTVTEAVEETEREVDTESESSDASSLR
jgi:hypothetical protein